MTMIPTFEDYLKQTQELDEGVGKNMLAGALIFAAGMFGGKHLANQPTATSVPAKTTVQAKAQAKAGIQVPTWQNQEMGGGRTLDGAGIKAAFEKLGEEIERGDDTFVTAEDDGAYMGIGIVEIDPAAPGNRTEAKLLSLKIQNEIKAKSGAKRGICTQTMRSGNHDFVLAYWTPALGQAAASASAQMRN